jgi:hypothetical protein
MSQLVHKADIGRLQNDLSSSHVLMTSGVLRLTRYDAFVLSLGMGDATALKSK